VLERVAFGERSEGLVGVVRIPAHGLADLDPAIHAADPLVTVVEGVEKPGNLGAVLRSVDGAGGSSRIAADPVTDLFNPNAIRASLGTIFAVPVAAGSSAAVLGWLRDRGIRILAARVDGGVEYTAADLTGPLAIVLGSEVAGLGPAWTDREISPIRLPMAGVADSLNVSIAAAVLLYEARRQREMRARA
jgi:TrmH family RNA methyltransferase